MYSQRLFTHTKIELQNDLSNNRVGCAGGINLWDTISHFASLSPIREQTYFSGFDL